MRDLLVSFIIPHKGREKLLIETIQSISLQDANTKQTEVIIVSQNKKISNNIRLLSKQLTITITIYLRPNEETISALRNFGASKSKGKYLTFIDADIYLSSNWLTCMLKEINDTSTNKILISAIQENHKNAPVIERIRTALYNIPQDQFVGVLHGSNLFMKYSTYNKSGGFPEELSTCEDVYFTTLVSKLGKLFFTSKASYIHLGEDKNYYEMFKKEIWRGQSNLRSIKGRKIPFRELPSLIIPIFFIIFPVLSIFLLIVEQYALSLISILLMLLPVVVYSIRLWKNSIAQGVRIIDIVIFYFIYFLARSIGTYKNSLN